jgi:hypothetical protein
VKDEKRRSVCRDQDHDMEGTFDHDDVRSENTLCLQYLAAICQQLLMHVECLEQQVYSGYFVAFPVPDNPIVAYTCTVYHWRLGASP